jgi:FkbM family methyltransferase
MNPDVSTPAASGDPVLQGLYTRVTRALTLFGDRASSKPPWVGRKVVIYGAGFFGRDVAKLLLNQGVAVLGFLDQKGSGEVVLGELRAYSPSSPEARRLLAEKPIVLIGTNNRAASLREIATLLIGLGFAEVVTPMEIYLHLGKELGWRFWLGTKEDYANAATSVDRLRGLWADGESERLFLEILLFRLEFDLGALSKVSLEPDQYADPTVPRWREPIRMVDGGAYTGDTLCSLLKRGYRFDAFHGFEPDLENFGKLRDTVSTSLPGAASSLWPCGVWSATTRLKFSEGGGSSSKLSELGATYVPVVALDDVLHGQAVNLIKLDIEGAEAEALQGARNLIQEYRPGLAICLYHHPHHLWSIPLWVANLDLGYTLYCRTYAQSTFETVLYAIPL